MKNLVFNFKILDIKNNVVKLDFTFDLPFKNK